MTKSNGSQPESREPRPRGRPRKSGSGPRIPPASREARQRVAAILDVWTGLCTPQDAAQLLGVSLPRFYAFETRLLDSMVIACENRPRGPRHGPEREIAMLRREVERLKQECARKQALVRVVQRTAGLPLPERRPTAKGKRRPRRPTIRALAIAKSLRAETTPESSPDSTAA